MKPRRVVSAINSVQDDLSDNGSAMTRFGSGRYVPILLPLLGFVLRAVVIEMPIACADEPRTEFAVSDFALEDTFEDVAPTFDLSSSEDGATFPQSDDADSPATATQMSDCSNSATASSANPYSCDCGRPGCRCGQSGDGAPIDPAMNAYQVLFFNNDFSYLVDDPGVTTYFTDATKRLRVGHHLTFDIGGAYRMRHHFENNMALSTLNALDNEFLLQRTRLYANAEIGKRFRLFTEMLDAASSYENLPPRAIDENRADFINIFADATIWDTDDGKLIARAGRQELLYGAQRLVSPLDWANTRRTFDGAKFFWRGTDWNVDGFWTRPVPLLQHVPNDHNFDVPDQSREFLGLYATNKSFDDHVLDLYYLRLADYDGPRGDINANTFGARWKGERGCWLWEFEGGYQFGEFATRDLSAGFYTLGFGRALRDLPGDPAFWVYFDWASGDANPLDGDDGTFIQLFPLSHKYLGFMDLVARKNIQSWNFLATAQLHKRVGLLVWWYIFHLEESRDALYNAPGAPIRIDPTGAAGTDVGQEIDILLDVTINARTDLFFGYSHFFSGSFVANTPPFIAVDADFVYTQLTRRF